MRIKILRTIFILLLISLAINGCTATTNKNEALIPPSNNLAIVKGVDNPTLSYALPSLKPRIELSFIKIDGKNTEKSAWSGYPFEVTLSPGEHELFIYYSNIGQPANFSGETTINIEVQGGSIYQLKPILRPGFRCDVKVSKIYPK